MSGKFLSEIARRQFEEDLLEQVLEAERVYRDAVSESRRPGTTPSDAEQKALAKYRRLLGLFTNLVLDEQPSRGLLLKTVLDTAIETVGADRGAIQVVVASAVLKLEAQRGFGREESDKVYGDTSCRIALETSQRVVVEDVTQSPLFAGTRSLQAMLQAGLRAVQSTPLLNRLGEPVGILSTHFREATHLGGRELSRLDRLSRQAAQFIEAYG